jgi:hypothetical protein
MIGLASKAQSEKSNETLNRIQFSVPVSLPITYTGWADELQDLMRGS